MNKDTDNSSRLLKNLVKSVYMPLRLSGESMTLAKTIQHNRIYYYSYGRHAMHQGLKVCGIGKGDVVLMPELICRDLLSSIHALGAKVEYYPVGQDLQLSCDPENLPWAKAVVAVNYFAFPQRLEPFRKYCEINGSLLVEDNAHGFLSRDENFRFLGTRGDIGIFSLRKTLPLYNGAALTLNHVEKYQSDPIQSPCSELPSSLGFKVKEGLRASVPFLGTCLPAIFTNVTRKIRRLKTGHEILPSLPDAEQNLPFETRPWQNLEKVIYHVNFDHEITRRQELFRAIHNLLQDLPLQPVFSELPPYVAPYVYPFYCKPGDINLIKKSLCQNSLECFPWPELPNEILNKSCPEYYSRIWGVKLLW